MNRVIHSKISVLSLVAFCGGALLLTSGLQSVVADDTTIDAAGVEYFEKHVRPLLINHCYDCHSGDEDNGGLRVDSGPALLRGGDSGPALVPGKPDKSLLLEVMRYTNFDLQMPPQNKLPQRDLDIIEKWIAMGAPDPRTEEAESSGPKPVGMSLAEGKDFWSFKPLANAQPPEVQQTDWVRNPIDQFVLAQLEPKNLQPAPPADKRTLLRRVTYDLIGLPPTPEEMAEFLADESPEAYEKVIERLLASPQYGVRWGRHWLDVARYADSNGLDENLAFGNAWRYRDYVIDAFNKDKPFNRFLVEQMAGDLLPEPSREALTATGYLALGARVLAEPDREKLEMDTIDEQLDSLGKTFLGMTFGCVRCHDHKFDPISHKDYYALAAIFKSTRSFADSNTGAIKHWFEHSFADEEEQERLKEIDKQIAEKNRAASAYKSQATSALVTKTQGLATEYLQAAAQVHPQDSLNEVAEIAEPLGLHPRVLHHCRLHLHYHQDDPFFAPWHELAAEGNLVGIEQHYRPLFQQAETAWAEARKADPKITKLEDEELEQARLVLHDRSGLLAIPAKPEFAFDDETLAEYYRLMEEARLFESAAEDLAAAMGVSDGDIHPELPLHIRGSHRNLGEPVAREFPAVMRISEVRPVLPAKSSGRLELAEWMASTQHPLTARVYVNRLWRWHFGQGIVNTPDNFGVLGDRPSHPELLDWLARTFMEQGWSTKEMHRLIMTSATYRMASQHPEESTLVELDPENRLFWKFPLRRLEAEALRDAILAVSGRIDLSLGGKSVPLRNRQFVFNHTSVDHTKYDSVRRAAYLPVIRNNLYTFFEQFDFPDPTMPTGDRQTTVVAPQALLLMNGELALASADAWAKQLLSLEMDDQDRLRKAYEQALGRPPEEHEIQRALTYISEWTSAAMERQTPSSPELAAWSLFCQSLFASNEFLFVR